MAAAGLHPQTQISRPQEIRKVQVRAAAPRCQNARWEGGVTKTPRRQARRSVFTEPTTYVPLLPVTGGHPYFLKLF